MDYIGNRSLLIKVAYRITYIWLFAMISCPTLAQSGPGGVGNSSSNRFWYDANLIGQSDGTPVASWLNTGGNTTVADQATVASRPTFLTNQLNGLPVVHFDGTDDYLEIATNTDLDNGGPYSQRTLAAVFRTGANITARQVIYEEGAGTRGINLYLFNGLLYFGSWNLASDGPGSPWGFTSATTAVSTNATYIVTLLFNGNSLSTGTIQCFLNGTLVGTLPNIGLLYTHDPANFGAAISGSVYESGTTTTTGNYFTGDLAEFILFNNVTNAAQRILVENYLSAKYGLTLAANDLYQMDMPGNGNYDFEMAGIGQVDNPGNRHIDAQGPSVVRVSGPVGLDDAEYLLWGHDNGSISLPGNTTDVPSVGGVNSRYERIWRTTMVGSITSYDVRLYLTCSSITVNNAYLLIDTNGDGDFGDETVAGGGVLLLSNLGSGEYIRTGVTALTDGRRFTFGFDGGPPPIFISALGPGGIGDNSVNRFWFDASDLNVANNSTVTPWVNKGGNTTNFTQGTAGNRPTFLTNQVNGLPLLSFDGANDYFTMANSTDLNSGGPYTNRTFSIMFRTSANVTARQVIFEEGGATRGMNMYLFNGNVYVGAFNISADSPDTPWGFVSLNTAVAANTSYILTFIVRGNTCKTGTITAFLNGVQMGTINNIGQLFGHTGAIGLGAKNNDTYYEYGASAGNGEYYNGQIGEFIMYNFDVNSAQRVIIENYLSSKYGIILGANEVYTMDNPANGNYDYQVAGIGRLSLFEYDNDSKGPGVVRVLSPATLGDNTYFIWGHDNQAFNSSGVTDLPLTIESRLQRTWRASETGEVGSFIITFDLTAVPGSKTAADLRLLVDRNNDGLFADETVGGGGVITGALSLGSGVYQFTNVNINDGQRFTIGSSSAATTPLPITLLSFTAACTSEGVNLEWKTASELNNDYFTLEKSQDGKMFYELIKISGAGTSRTKNTYSFVDAEVLSGRAYYRLSQTDFDRTSKSFDIILADCESDGLAFSVYPNPSEGTFTIDLPTETFEIIIADQMGRTLLTQHPNERVTRIDMSDYPVGIYIVITSGSSGRHVQKVVVSR